MICARTLLVGVIAAHVAISAIHGVVHLVIPVHVHSWQYGYAGVVILLVPLVGGLRIGRGGTAATVWLVLLSGIGALAFEGISHFVVVNPDHVATVETGRTLFRSTAALSTTSDAVLVVASAWLLVRSIRGHQDELDIETA